MELRSNSIPGCYEILPNLFQDDRGRFVKIFHENVFKAHQLNTQFAEEYYSRSHKHVLRGLHFQTPPMDHVKMVYCVLGNVLDVVVDLRIGSPTYGKHEQFSLTSEKGNIVYIPAGLAHGFYVLSETAILIYKVSTVYNKELDSGIHWDSVGISWPDHNPIVSERDAGLQPFSDFESTFVYNG